MDLPQNVTTNISIPFIGTVVANIASTHPEVGIAWLGISSTYLFFKAMDPRADDFIKKINKNIGGISEELVKSTEFQQSLLITFDALIRARSEGKKKVIKRIYLSGYIRETDKKQFELERFYNTAQNLSPQSIAFLRFFIKEILPKFQHWDIKKALGMIKRGDSNVSYVFPMTPLIYNWFKDNYDIPISKLGHFKSLNKKDRLLKSQLTNDRVKFASTFQAACAELVCLGFLQFVIGDRKESIVGTEYYISLFGLRYLDFLELI